jgi:hypothetical protein
MAGLTPEPLVHGEEGALQVREIFRVAVASDQPLMACLCGLWISLYGPGTPPGFGLSLDDLQEAAGTGTLTIKVNGDRTRWDYLLESKVGNQSGYKSVAHLDFETIGTA